MQYFKKQYTSTSIYNKDSLLQIRNSVHLTHLKHNLSPLEYTNFINSYNTDPNNIPNMDVIYSSLSNLINLIITSENTSVDLTLNRDNNEIILDQSCNTLILEIKPTSYKILRSGYITPKDKDNINNKFTSLDDDIKTCLQNNNYLYSYTSELLNDILKHPYLKPKHKINLQNWLVNYKNILESFVLNTKISNNSSKTSLPRI